MAVLKQFPAGKPPGTPPPAQPRGTLLLNELYYTIQGECRYQGTPTVFVRTSHCTLRCVWCDSKYTFTGGTPYPIEKILHEVAKYPTKHVCLTGGEPLDQPDSVPLLMRLAESGCTVEVETSGSVDITPINQFPTKLRKQIIVNLDIKCPGSAMTNFNHMPNLGNLLPHDQLKFILLDRIDYQFAKNVLKVHPVPCEVFLHPVWGKLDPAEIADWVKTDGLAVRVGVQLHKYIWGDVRGV